MRGNVDRGYRSLCSLNPRLNSCTALRCLRLYYATPALTDCLLVNISRTVLAMRRSVGIEMS
jgi:hypothetical protein